MRGLPLRPLSARKNRESNSSMSEKNRVEASKRCIPGKDSGQEIKEKPSKKRFGRPSGMDMLHGPLRGKIVLFAIPLALSSVLQQLLSSADAIVAGRFLGSVELAAIGGIAPVITLFIGLFVGMSIGTNASIATRIGHGEHDKIHAAVQTTAVLAFVCAIAVMLAGELACEGVVDAVAVPAEARADAVIYLRIYLAGIAFFLVYNFGSAILRAKGDTRRPLYALAVAAAVNCALDVAAVAAFDAGVAGIALATVVSYAIAAGIVVALLMREEPAFRLDLRGLAVDRRALRQILYIGVPSGLQSVVFSLSNIVIQASINSFGTDAIAGSTAALNFEYYTYFIVSAFSQAAITFISQNYAAGKLLRCDKVIRFCMGASVGLSLAVSLLFVGLGDIALGVFTTESGALGFAAIRMWHVELLECLPSTYEITAGAMRGMGWSILPTVVVVIGSCVLRVVFVYTLFPMLGTFEMLMNIYPVSWIITGATMIGLCLFARKRSYGKVIERAHERARKMELKAKSAQTSC